jgi:diguanylate cyclase
LILQIAALIVAVFLGFFVGWLVRTGERQLRDAGNGDDQTPAPDANAIAAEPADTDSVAVREILAGLQELAQSVASDVGAHNNRVQEINRELVAAPAQASIVGAVKTLIRANETMQSQLSQAEVRLQAQAGEIERHVREARTDALTKLGNRRFLEEELARFAQTACDPSTSAWLMLIDLDRFKKFNDTYGHPAGDEVLRGVARVLRDHLSTDAVVCRHGGEEFAAIFTSASANAACSAAEELRKAISREIFLFEGIELRLTTSCGLVQFLADEKAEHVLKRCDEALYQAKHHGRNCGYLHDGSNLQPLTAAGCDPDSRTDCDPHESAISQIPPRNRY